MWPIVIISKLLSAIKNNLFALLIGCLLWSAAFSQAVYLTPTAKKYHLQQGINVHHFSKRIDIKLAQKRNYQACESCIPQTQTVVKEKSSSKLENEKVFCTARTSNGNKCLNTIHAPQKFCDEHLKIG